MKVQITPLDAATARGAELTEQWLKDAAEIMTPQALAEIAARAVEKAASEARRIVRTTAKERTGALEEAIGHHEYAKPQSSGSYLSWKLTPRKLEGRRRKSSTTYRDAKFRLRKVETVADVGRLLEYSASRKLRHINLGFSRTEDEIERYMLDEINALLDKAGL